MSSSSGGVSIDPKSERSMYPRFRWRESRWVHNTYPEDIVNSFKRHDVTAVILFRVPICIQSYPFGRSSASHLLFPPSLRPSSPSFPLFHSHYHGGESRGLSRPIASLRDQNRPCARDSIISMIRVCLFRVLDPLLLRYIAVVLLFLYIIITIATRSK